MTITRDRGYVLVELLLGAAITCAISAVLLDLAIGAQRATTLQADAADQQQRLRVIAEALRHDLAMAGAGESRGPGMGPLNQVLAPVIAARVGVLNADPELTVRTDRISIMYVPETRSQTILRSGMGAVSSPLAIDGGAPACAPGTVCDFAIGDRAIIYDRPEDGNAYEILTVSAVDPIRNLLTPAAPLGRAYAAGARVAAVVVRTYYFDAPGKRLMSYDGDRSDLPLVDHVTALGFELLTDASAVLGTAQLTDGPFMGAAPNRFDADFLRVRRVVVTVRLESESGSKMPQLEGRVDIVLPNMARQ